MKKRRMTGRCVGVAALHEDMRQAWNLAHSPSDITFFIATSCMHVILAQAECWVNAFANYIDIVEKTVTQNRVLPWLRELIVHVQISKQCDHVKAANYNSLVENEFWRKDRLLRKVRFFSNGAHENWFGCSAILQLFNCCNLMQGITLRTGLCANNLAISRHRGQPDLGMSTSV